MFHNSEHANYEFNADFLINLFVPEEVKKRSKRSRCFVSSVSTTIVTHFPINYGALHYLMLRFFISFSADTDFYEVSLTEKTATTPNQHLS